MVIYRNYINQENKIKSKSYLYIFVVSYKCEYMLFSCYFFLIHIHFNGEISWKNILDRFTSGLLMEINKYFT